MKFKILKKMLEKSGQFLSSEQPCEPKSLEVALKIAEVEKIYLENLEVNLEARCRCRCRLFDDVEF